MLARAGYEPREMANMFKTIEEEGGGGGPEWLSSHPNPGNRYNAITKEAASLQVQGKGDTGQFNSIQARLRTWVRRIPPNRSRQKKAKTGGPRTPDRGGRPTAVRRRASIGAVAPIQPAKFLQVDVPSNWDPIGRQRHVRAAGRASSRAERPRFTHGVQFGVAQGTGNLQRDTQL